MPEFAAALVDLDGTVWRGDEVVPGARRGVETFRDAGVPVVFVTNNTGSSASEFAARLRDHGVPAGDVTEDGRVVTSTTATAEYLLETDPDASVFVVGRETIANELAAAGLDVVTSGTADVVVAGMTDVLSFDLLTRALRAFDADTRFVATNTDRVTPGESGPLPGSGAVVGAVQGMVGAEPAVGGKPATRMARMALADVDADPEDCLVVGDNLHTDILMGEGAGMTTALVLTGASDRAEIVDSGITPDYVLDSLGDVERVL